MYVCCEKAGFYNDVQDTVTTTAPDVPAPPMVSREQARQQLTPGILSYLAESRRLSNSRMKAELGVVLRYPDLAAGLPASLQAGQ